MSRCTADLEFLQCDLCLTYFHKDIFCPHRRDCKGLNSQEMKKSEAEKMRVDLDKLEDQRSHNDTNNPAIMIPRAQLEKMQKSQDMKKRTELANEWADEEDRKLKEKFSKNATDAALAFLDS